MNYVEDVIEMLCSVHVEQIKINEVFQESESLRRHTSTPDIHTNIEDNQKNRKPTWNKNEWKSEVKWREANLTSFTSNK